MARYGRLVILNQMQELGLVPVFYEPNVDLAKKIVSACARGGALVVEMTNRGDGAINVFAELERYCASEHPEVALGAGSVVDAYTAAQYVNQGAAFIVGPVLDRETAIACNKRKVPYSPGCGSVTEIHEAHALGVEIVKVFPGAQVGGPEFVKSVLGPIPWASIMPTGGVSPSRESLTEWFRAGIVCAGIGSQLIRRDLVAARDFDQLAGDVRQLVELIREVRHSLGRRE
jgi:2-dehydro-3-deoxyphosphogluconate aldolase/(4S)-4-hydroxy-2-oxoglutarate aldolase